MPLHHSLFSFFLNPPVHFLSSRLDQQTVLIRVSMDGHMKFRTKALKIAVSVKGVESASLKGDEKDQIEVKGDMIDTVELTSLLRKKVGPAHIITVEAQKKEEPKVLECIAWPYGGGESSNPCSIM
ncbi:heavy metal-associated isoprenylated plant protein 46-like isoform X2 [Juglans microcarpa x Juglans regia]|uniref:heavy metal-associated isoprenylated plant protein 46-like isoform X2 n=1 Tax=Juglans microcarpa x Juglans regia TaxID=2249226 RepID=UPI001B7E55CA|nr:heavy metal-associated isoprenylated plant protein 46-like isoform X2 [Juglans microcarpa x Juglans regia]